MNENLQRQRPHPRLRHVRPTPETLRLLDRFNVPDRVLPGHHHQVASNVPRKLHPGFTRHRHLRGTMDGKVRRQSTDQPADPHILHNRGIHPRRDDRPEILGGILQLLGEDQRVERHVAPHPAPVQELHQLRQIRFGEVVGPHPGIEPVQPEVNRVRSVLHRRTRAFPIARRRQQFGESHRGFKRWTVHQAKK